MAVRDRPLLTDTYSSTNEFTPKEDSIYIFCAEGEERCAHSPEWEAKANRVTFARITDQSLNGFEVVVNENKRRILLRSGKQLQEWLVDFGPVTIYLDITGLGHHVWAPLLKAALQTTVDIKVVYVEPSDYRFSLTPTEGAIFDLSERTHGIAPIPGFAVLEDVADQAVCFVPLLGFEGTRLKYIIEQVQPHKVVPIIGVPGFRAEFPFHAYLGNRLPLIENEAWKKVRFALANCPFSLFYTLEDIAKMYPQDMLKIAPIGTKPHALGAVLYTLASPRSVELVYDHPIRRQGRTVGTARLLVYHVSALSFSNIRK